jgi:short-subunit dehydrogenase
VTRLAGKVVWITGASSGIGEALAVAAVQRGARVVITARREDELRRVRDRCVEPSAVALLALDLTTANIEIAAERAAACFGPIDVLVNNAGLSQRGGVADTDLETYRRIFELDFFAPVALTKAVLPTMRKRGGHVVMIGSVVSRVATPQRSGYSAAKHALDGFTESARVELWREGVRFTFVMPGFVRTQVSLNALEGNGARHGQMDRRTAAGMSPERCAEAIWAGVERNRDELTIAGAEGVSMLLRRWFPGLLRWALKRARVY